MFENISPAPPDAILGLTEAFNKDPSTTKINLGAGVYQNDNGETPILATVKMAEGILLERERTKSYLPIAGSPEYGQLVQELLFGQGHGIVASGRAKTVHTPGGTAALRVGADFLKTLVPEAKVWLSDPSWPNHRAVFAAAGFEVKQYPYYDSAAKALDFTRMSHALRQISPGDVVVLHVCCHNPTGVDPLSQQWEEIATIARDRRWVPFLDFAYQGFGVNLEADRLAIEQFLGNVTELLIASSFSKNFGLYQERTGALTLSASNAEAADAALSHIKKIIRANYSNPPAHGGKIVTTILGDATLRAQWEAEVVEMRERIKSMRMALVKGLQARNAAEDFSFIRAQNGIFSFSGLADGQVDYLRTRKSIYMVEGGRMNVAGITTKNVDYLCDSIAEALKQ